MALDLAAYESNACKAVKGFWSKRLNASLKQRDAGRADRGERSGVTGGNNMNGFVELIIGVVKANGLAHASIHQQRKVLTLPGYFRPTKLWDLVVIHKGELIAAVELKSHVGPSFGNNFNNRTEEAIGTGHDLWTALREGAFGQQPRPFVGWLMLVEDAAGSNSPVRDGAPHFPVFPEFKGASYLRRYDILCQRLARENIYSAASVISARRADAKSGRYKDLSDATSLKTFVATLAGHVAASAARFE